MQHVHRLTILLTAALGCSTTPILIGYDMTLVGSIIANEEFIQAFGVYDRNIDGWILPADHQLIWTIVQYVSAAGCAFLAGFLNDICGRRVCFFLTISLTVAGALVELFSPDWKVWIAAKLLMGMAMGSMQGNTQTYVSEITPAEIRGFTLSLFQFWILLGSLIASCVLQGTAGIEGGWSWKAAVATQFGPAALCLALFVPFVPESPYHLVAKGRLDDARAALGKIRGGAQDGFDADEEVCAMQSTLDHERRSRAAAAAATQQTSYSECLRGTHLRRTLIACLPVVMQLFMGYPLCGNYLAYFLTLAGIDDAFLITLISALCSLVSAALAFFLIERVGRRPQLLFGVCGMLGCLLVIGLLGFFGSGEVWNSRAVSAFCIVWAVLYYMSVGAVGWTIVGEISTARLRAKTTSLAAVSSSVFNMAWSIAIPYLVNAEKADLGAKCGLIFFGFGLCFGVAAFFSIPETKGKTFGELDALFAASTPSRKF
ncbi:putative mfs hexose transporter [Diplodia seriata]|uniref:Putative mfs hexose transporter n=1 Tax=Diplodia seriata TaxID=420778 RepID=A0A0G2DTG1_9PEZI|nr:putative mfs hexose transporter [Diplodia seriata]